MLLLDFASSRLLQVFQHTQTSGMFTGAWNGHRNCGCSDPNAPLRCTLDGRRVHLAVAPLRTWDQDFARLASPGFELIRFALVGFLAARVCPVAASNARGQSKPLAPD